MILETLVISLILNINKVGRVIYNYGVLKVRLFSKV